MDYLGWELERQRAALAALLLGGGNARDRESVRDETRQSGAGTPEPDAGGGQQASGAWEALPAARQRREPGGSGIVETPVSAWEAVLGGEVVWAARRDLGDGGSGTVETPWSAWEAILGEGTGVPVHSQESARLRLYGGTGAQPEFPRPSDGYAARRGMRRTDTGPAAETQDTRTGGDGAENSAVPPGTGVDQGSAAGGTAAAGRSGRFFRIRRSGGSAAGASEPDEPAASTALWGGGPGAAVLRAEEGAKLLSRAVQRDARRYDGGFNIF